jgi:hypothetical protein
MITRMNRLVSIRALMTVAALTLGGATGCTHFAINTPGGFAQLQHQAPQFDYRAVSAYGVAIGVRVVSNREHGNLDFWSEAADRYLQANGPYHAAGRVDVHGANGIHGRRLAYTYGDAQTGGTYWVAVYVTDTRVFLVEAGGNNDAFARARPSVEQALSSFRGG